MNARSSLNAGVPRQDTFDASFGGFASDFPRTMLFYLLVQVSDEALSKRVLCGEDAEITLPMTGPKTVRATFIPMLDPHFVGRRIQNEWILLTFDAQSNLNYVVEASVDLENWSPAKTFGAISGAAEVILPLDLQAAPAFYRLQATLRQ